MKQTLLSILLCFSFISSGIAQSTEDVSLAKTILADSRLDTIQNRALKLLSGFSAGTSYNEVWIRDFNTLSKDP
jgi:hypothetical protein